MRWYANLSVLYKILLVTLIGVAGFIVYLGYNYSVTKENSQRLSDIATVEYPVLETVDTNIALLDKIIDSLNGAVAAGEPEMELSAHTQADTVREGFKKIAAIDSSLSRDVEKLSRLFEAYFNDADVLTHAMLDGTADMAEVPRFMERMGASLNAYKDAIGEFRKARYELFLSTLEDSNVAGNRALAVGLGLGILVIGVMLLSSWSFAFLLRRDLGGVIRSLRELSMGEGDLTVRIPSKGNDELGVLVSEFNKFLASLQGIVRQVVGATGEISSASSEMTSAARQAKSSSEQQKLLTERVAAAVTELSSTVQDMASHAAQAASSAEQATDETQSGRDVVNQSIQLTNEVAGEVENVSRAIQQLKTDSGKIGVVLDVIRDISEQTNLLALNAAIEAARAGDQGRGFAVVADEVRTLANRTQESTKEIQQTISQLQAGSEKAVLAMAQGRDKAMRGVAQSEKTDSSLEAISAAIERISSMNTHIATATEQQSSVTAEITDRVLEIARRANESADVADATSVASESLSHLAGELNRLIGKFKV